MFTLQWQNIFLPAYKQGPTLWCRNEGGEEKVLQYFCHPALLYPALVPGSATLACGHK